MSLRPDGVAVHTIYLGGRALRVRADWSFGEVLSRYVLDEAGQIQLDATVAQSLGLSLDRFRDMLRVELDRYRLADYVATPPAPVTPVAAEAPASTTTPEALAAWMAGLMRPTLGPAPYTARDLLDHEREHPPVWAVYYSANTRALELHMSAPSPALLSRAAALHGKPQRFYEQGQGWVARWALGRGVRGAAAERALTAALKVAL